MLVKRIFVDGTTEQREFASIDDAKKPKGKAKKKVGILKILDTVTGVVLAVVSLLKIVKK